MNEHKLIMFQSITYATKARNILLRYGVNSDIVKTPKVNGRSSCGYSLKGFSDLDAAVGILNANNIRILGVSDGDSL